MDQLENVALIALLSQAAHQLQHFSDNAKNPHTKERLAPLLTAVKGAIANLATM